MKIGDVAARAGVSPRAVRYYEQEGLVGAARAANGYRTYTESDVELVQRIAAMVQAGLPTRLVRVLLDMERAAANQEPTCPREVAELLASELAGIEARLACLTRSRDAVRDFLHRTEHSALLAEVPAPDQGAVHSSE